MKTRLPILLCAVALSGCAGTSATVTADLAKAKADLTSASTYVGVAIGIAQVAELAEPALAPFIGPAITALQALNATAQATLASATADATSVESLATMIQSQAVTLTNTAAPAIKVVSSVTKS